MSAPAWKRLPWKRGPIAWKVAIGADQIRSKLVADPRQFHSLRRAARIMGVSTQPLRDWNKGKFLHRGGPRLRFSTPELLRFIDWLQARAQPFGAEQYLKRIFGRQGRPTFSFNKLRSARFVWPKGRLTLSPAELSARIGCHPSLLLKAIRASALRGRFRSPARWEITRRAWTKAFPSTLIPSRYCPPLPDGRLFPIGLVARYLRKCGVAMADAERVRKLLRDQYLEPGYRRGMGKLFVTRGSLRKYRNFLKKGP
jgi:hypothetical protein